MHTPSQHAKYQILLLPQSLFFSKFDIIEDEVIFASVLSQRRNEYG